MTLERLAGKYLPMTETTYYILLSLRSPRHGYAIMQHTRRLTDDRVGIGAGTMYTTLGRLEKDGLIEPVAEEGRRKICTISETGRALLQQEIFRLEELVRHGRGNQE